ncbi:hypothetical protein ACQPW3_07095 [Actinosynnema sp. CA-248983]
MFSGQFDRERAEVAESVDHVVRDAVLPLDLRPRHLQLTEIFNSLKENFLFVGETAASERLDLAAAGKRLDLAVAGGRLAQAVAGGRLAQAVAGGRLAQAIAGKRLAQAIAGKRLAQPIAGKRLAQPIAGGRLAQAVAGGRLEQVEPQPAAEEFFAETRSGHRRLP